MSDPAESGMNDGDSIGILGIDMMTRRRNRLNGIIQRIADDYFKVTVEQAFGNCPRYIQVRNHTFTRPPEEISPVPMRILTTLDERAREIILGADTFFVASYIQREGKKLVDVSHRGGNTGFVHISEDGVLTIPDFSGNLFFNTLGNFLLNARAGLAFVDFATGDTLQLVGDAEVLLESPEIAAFRGAERIWRFLPRKVVHRPQGLPLRWSFDPSNWSPNTLMTGNWNEAALRLAVTGMVARWRPFRIDRIVEESATIRSLYLHPEDGSGIPFYRAGQHLSIRVRPEGKERPEIRSYTLSSAPSDSYYRISIKRQGFVSSYLHTLREGEVIEISDPSGAFTIDSQEKRPAVLLAAGIGITPIIAMLRHLIHEGGRTGLFRPTWLFYGARTKAERAFDQEINTLMDGTHDVLHRIRVLSSEIDAISGRDYEALGKVDIALLQSTLGFDDYDFFLCGPSGFMQTLYDGLRALNVDDSRIYAEAFGPAGLTRNVHKVMSVPSVRSLQPAETPTPIVFARSFKEAIWTQESGSLLELAEECGLSPMFGCRSGSCGTCRIRILSGEVAYPSPPTAEIPNDEALICCATPAQAPDGLVHPLCLEL